MLSWLPPYSSPGLGRSELEQFLALGPWALGWWGSAVWGEHLKLTAGLLDINRNEIVTDAGTVGVKSLAEERGGSGLEVLMTLTLRIVKADLRILP